MGRPLGMVLKADGLAAGKGVYVCDNLRQALDGIDQIMVRRIFGQAGDRMLIEERLDGHEASVLAITDGRTIIPLESSQDYKRAFDHDEGPNTGGMGAFSPTAVLNRELMEQVESEILVPVIHALKRARRPFRGVIYAGLMLTNQGPKVLEFNVRFGDPETQAVLMRLKSDFFEVLQAAVDENLDTINIEWDPRPSVTVVMASEGYPGNYERDRLIQNLEAVDRLPDVKVFHAGTALRADPAARERIGSSPTVDAFSTSPHWARPWKRLVLEPMKPFGRSSSPARGTAAISPASPAERPIDLEVSDTNRLPIRCTAGLRVPGLPCPCCDPLTPNCYGLGAISCF